MDYSTYQVNPDFRGNILVCQHGQISLEYSAGYADLANRVPNTSDTRFATASAGKLFVAVSILQLIERGRLTLESTLWALADFDLGRIDPAVTVRELLSHTSGVPDYFDEEEMDDYEALWHDFPNYRIRSNRDLLPLFVNRPMMYPHGTRFQYNNSGYVLLALIIEAATGMLFDEYLMQNVFLPAGMTRTGYYELDCLPDKCANSYIFDRERGRYRTNIYSVDAKGTGAGGAFITVRDICAFWKALLAGKLLKEETVADMMRDHSGVGEYGYGIWLKDRYGSTPPYFEGMDPGVSFVSCYDAAQDLIIAAVSNYCDNVWQIARELRGFTPPAQT
ncbi:MAG: beta-lactamase family protein [Ruminococcaceae bacterium]|nr:beta-lactamase family protein [Oscillospiraceae bacterium]